MFYVTMAGVGPEGDQIYCLFDTNTYSYARCKDDLLEWMLTEKKMNIVNVKMIDGKATLNKPYQNLLKGQTGERDHTITCKIGDSYIMVRDNTYGSISEEVLKEYTKMGRLTNCKIVDGKLKIYDTYKIQQDIEFAMNIHKEYNKFAAKSKLVGRDMSFTYCIEGHNVILKEYKGTDDRPIVPKFITSIGQGAFEFSGIRDVKLNEGLKYIGSRAFSVNNLREVTIPETVEYIFDAAFNSNKNALAVGGCARLNLKNHKTDIIDQVIATQFIANKGINIWDLGLDM